MDMGAASRPLLKHTSIGGSIRIVISSDLDTKGVLRMVQGRNMSEWTMATRVNKKGRRPAGNRYRKWNYAGVDVTK
jgi:hypothetical protein